MRQLVAQELGISRIVFQMQDAERLIHVWFADDLEKTPHKQAARRPKVKRDEASRMKLFFAVDIPARCFRLSGSLAN
jgi:hypothetical protein